MVGCFSAFDSALGADLLLPRYRWIGGLGIMATHGVVQARLILNGKDMGPHLFLVQRELGVADLGFSRATC